MPSPFAVDKGALLVNVLDYLDVRYNRTRVGWQTVHCPGAGHSHGDRTPSASVNLQAGRFHCFGCGLQGDGFDLMLELEGVKAAEVTDMLNVEREERQDEWLL